MQSLCKQQDICFLPLDVPLIKEKQKIVEHFDALELEEYIWWHRDILLGDTDTVVPIGEQAFHWNPQPCEIYRNIISITENYLPFDQLYYVHIARAVSHVLPHVDENYVDDSTDYRKPITNELKNHLDTNEPIGYRGIISGNRNSLYICDEFDPNHLEVVYKNRKFCEVPQTTDFFLIQNSKIPHGVDHLEPDPKRLILFFLGSVDVNKHEVLIRKSIKKYSEYLVLKSDLFK